MSRYRTLSGLISDVRSRASQEQPGTVDAQRFISDAEITEWLNQGIAELQARLVIVAGQPHFRNQTSFTVTAPSSLYTLPADFFAVQEVTATVNGIVSALMPFMVSERASLVTTGVWAIYEGVKYRVQGNNIEFLPATQTFTATLYYTPSASRLVNASDAWDGFAGYEMAPIYDACAQCAAKEESDPSFFLAQRDRIYQHIERVAAHRDMSSPERVQDVMSRKIGEGWDF